MILCWCEVALKKKKNWLFDAKEYENHKLTAVARGDFQMSFESLGISDAVSEQMTPEEFYLHMDPGETSCAWGNYHKHRLSDSDCLPLMWPTSLWGLLWQLADEVTENKWSVFSCSWCWYGEEGANWVHRNGGFPKQWEDCALVPIWGTDMSFVYIAEAL